EDLVEVRNPPEKQAACSLGQQPKWAVPTEDREDDTLSRPGEAGSRPTDDVEQNRIEPAEEPSVAQRREPREVPGAGVDMLKERHLGVDEPSHSQHASYLRLHPVRVEDVFQHR